MLQTNDKSTIQYVVRYGKVAPEISNWGVRIGFIPEGKQLRLATTLSKV